MEQTAAPALLSLGLSLFHFFLRLLNFGTNQLISQDIGSQAGFLVGGLGYLSRVLDI